MSSGAYVWPVAGSGGRVSSPFGIRDTKNLPAGASRNHLGIDIAAPKGTGVLSALAGRVLNTGNSSARGNYITVDHGGGVVTEYEHLNSIGVRAGQQVGAGEQIGTVGSTGNSTGNHLEFRIKQNGKYVDPQKWQGRGASSGVAAVAGELEQRGLGGLLNFSFDGEAVTEAIKDNWILITGGILLIAILTKR